MFRLSFPLSIVIALMGCASRTHIVPTLASIETPTEGPPTLCADTSMIFRPEKGTYQFGLDPVETRQRILKSRSFRHALVSTDPLMSDAQYRIFRLGNSAVLRLVAEAETADDALRICRALSRTALADIEPDKNEGGAMEWLTNQRANVEREKLKAEQELTSFLKEHNLMAIDPTDQIGLLREQFIALKKEQARTLDKKRGSQLAKRAADLEEKLSDMVLLEIGYNHLKQSVEQQERMLMTMREHESEVVLNRLTAPSLQTLESCAPTNCEGSDRDW